LTLIAATRACARGAVLGRALAARCEPGGGVRQHPGSTTCVEGAMASLAFAATVLPYVRADSESEGEARRSWAPPYSSAPASHFRAFDCKLSMAWAAISMKCCLRGNSISPFSFATRRAAECR
jgi:hypothetical protein